MPKQYTAEVAEVGHLRTAQAARAERPRPGDVWREPRYSQRTDRPDEIHIVSATRELVVYAIMRRGLASGLMVRLTADWFRGLDGWELARWEE